VTISRRGLKVKIKVMCQANAVDLTSLEDSFLVKKRRAYPSKLEKSVASHNRETAADHIPFLLGQVLTSGDLHH